MQTFRSTRLWLAMGVWACFAASAARLAAQPVPPPDAEVPAADKGTDATADDPLSTRQRQVRDRFGELEKLLLRMAELTAPTDPGRAALLRQAVAQSKKRDIDHQFEELVSLLSQQRLSLALKGQTGVQQELARLLELLLSEDRNKRIESEKERVRAYLKRVNRLIKEQKSVQGDTSRDGETGPLAERQGKLSEDTGKLADDLAQEDAAKDPAKEEADDADKDPSKEAPSKKDPQDKAGKKDSDKNGEKSDKESDKSDKDAENQGDKDASDKKSDKQDSDSSKPDESKPGDKAEQGEKSPGEPADSEQQPGQPGQPNDQPPMPGQPGQQDPSEQQPPEDNPAQQRLQQAQQRMQEAQQKLEKAKREEAADKQAQALKELEQAKADLEEILRQLREEQMSRMLAMLEGRFRKMLDAQVEVYEGTKRLDQVAQAERDRDDEIEAGRLSRKEAEIVVEAEKCLGLLREEGSAVAFPEAVVEMRQDMQSVVERLARSEVGQLTQAVETDIIAALEEMIAAFKKAQKEMEQKQQQPGQQGQMANGEPPLVDALAELRMIRAMQMRVNVRTQRYAELSKTEQVETPELLKALEQLAEREQRIHQITRDIVVGRNR